MNHEHHAHHGRGGGHDHHALMVEDFRRRFWVSLALTVPVVATSEMLQHLFGLRGALAFPGDAWVGFLQDTSRSLAVRLIPPGASAAPPAK